MYAHYTPGSESMRELTADDIDGICSVYSPDGMRSVASEASSTGTLPEVTCDPTPRHGFTTQCMSASSSPSSSCSLRGAAASGRDEGAGGVTLVGGLALGVAIRLRRRRHGPSAS